MRNRNTRQAVTILEVAMVLVILAVAMPPLISAFAESSMHAILPTQMTVASFLAIERMEEVIARRARGTDGYDALTVPQIAAFPDESPVTDFPQYYRTVRVANVNHELSETGSDQGYKKVVVTVAWNGGDRQLVIERVFARFQP